MSLTADIKTLLTAINSNVYRGDMPDTPDNLICIYDTGGSPTDHSFDAKQFDHPSFQVRIRNTSYDTAIAQANAVKDALDGKTNQTINGSTYISIFQLSDILSLGKDHLNRTDLSINFQTKVKR